MSRHYLASLFTPESVALYGASDRMDSVGGVVFKNLLASRFKGRIYAINPMHSTVQGQPSYASLPDIKEDIDLAVVATSAASTPDIVEACGKRGIRMMLILSAGFREIGPEGRQLEDRVMQLIRLYGIRLMGPNCLGIMRPDIGLNVMFSNIQAQAGNLAIVSQSGSICSAILDWAALNDIGFSSVISSGISADLDFGDYLDYLASDPHTRAILLYIEGINNSRRFMSSLRVAARIKPVIALKVGRHAAGARASMSHTGALVGSDEIFSAALSRSGVLRVDTISQLFAAAKALSSLHYRGPSERLAIITNGGGTGVMAADRASDQGIELSTLGSATMDALNQALPAVWSHNNPVDIIGDAPPERYQKALDICLTDPQVDAALVVLTPQAMTDPGAVAEAIIDSASRSKKPIMTCWLGGPQVAQARQMFKQANLPSFIILENAVDAFSYIVRYKRNQRLLLQTPARLTHGQETPDVEGAELIIESVLKEERRVLTEPESMAVLSAFGIPAVPNGVAHSAEEALIIAEAIGFPIALKILSNDITHKSDAGGVSLNIHSSHDVAGAYHHLVDRVHAHAPNAAITGVTVEKMIRSTNGRELMIGILRDPVFGPVISFGSGGTSAEVMGDTAISLPPLNRQLALDLIHSTRIARLLEKFRHLPAANMEALIEVLLNVSSMACELPGIQEMDINPLIIDEHSIMAVDARIVVDYPKPATAPYHHLAIHPYPAHLICAVQLNDGTPITIRPIRPEDAEIEAAFVRNLSDESKYYRFMNALEELSQEMLIGFTQIDYHTQMALIAVHDGPEGEEQVGVARYTINQDQTSCEFALAVSDAWNGKGIAHHLMHHLMDVARDHNLDQMEGQVLSNNIRMLELMKSLNFTVHADPEDSQVKNVIAQLHARD